MLYQAHQNRYTATVTIPTRSFYEEGIDVTAAAALALALVACASGRAAVKEAGGVSSRDVTVMNGSREVPATMTLPADGGPFPLVVMEHGFAGSRSEGGGFDRLAEALARAGIASVRMDFPGCGGSAAPFLDYSLSANIADGEACRNWALKNAPLDAARVGLLGYSNGGRQALLIASGQHDYKAIGLLAPAFFTTANETLAGIFSRAETEARLAEAEAAGFYAMKFFGRTLQVSPRNYTDDLAAIDTLAALSPAQVTVPCLVVYGDQDTTVLPSISRSAAAAVGAAVVEVPGADHSYGFYSDQPSVSAVVIDAFVSFFQETL